MGRMGEGCAHLVPLWKNGPRPTARFPSPPPPHKNPGKSFAATIFKQVFAIYPLTEWALKNVIDIYIDVLICRLYILLHNLQISSLCETLASPKFYRTQIIAMTRRWGDGRFNIWFYFERTVQGSPLCPPPPTKSRKLFLLLQFSNRFSVYRCNEISPLPCDALKCVQWCCCTGARMLYKNLPRNVGLKRLTLHKSATGPNVNYILLVECSHFLDNINQVAASFCWLLPRPAATF